MTAGLSSRTSLYAVLGDPITHSLSPRFHNAAFDAAGLDAVYLALRCDAAAMPGLLTGIAQAGGGGNVTVPHKQLAWRVVTRRTDAAERTGACNTFWLQAGEIWGDNTDVAGFAAAVTMLIGRPAAGGRVLVAGAGGAARAAVWSLLEQGAVEIVLFARSPERAAAILADFARPDLLRAVDTVPSGAWDLVVNATPLGLRPDDALPFPASVAAGAALDLVYGPAETPWVRQMRAAGVAAADGREMLLQQGAAAFRCWFGRDAPLDVMRRALNAPP